MLCLYYSALHRAGWTGLQFTFSEVSRWGHRSTISNWTCWRRFSRRWDHQLPHTLDLGNQRPSLHFLCSVCSASLPHPPDAAPKIRPGEEDVVWTLSGPGTLLNPVKALYELSTWQADRNLLSLQSPKTSLVSLSPCLSNLPAVNLERAIPIVFDLSLPSVCGAGFRLHQGSPVEGPPTLPPGPSQSCSPHARLIPFF